MIFVWFAVFGVLCWCSLLFCLFCLVVRSTDSLCAGHDAWRGGGSQGASVRHAADRAACRPPVQQLYVLRVYVVLCVCVYVCTCIRFLLRLCVCVSSVFLPTVRFFFFFFFSFPPPHTASTYSQKENFFSAIIWMYDPSGVCE